MLTYTKIPSDTYQHLALNAGILVDDFDPSTETLGNQLAATSGGINFTATPEYIDFADGIDNARLNTKELKELSNWTVTLSGTLKTITPSLAKTMAAAADVDETDETLVVPRNTLDLNDFFTVWLICDYGKDGGYIAIELNNVLSTGGFQIQTNDRNKGDFAFTWTAHYSLDEDDVVPFKIYIKEGETETTTTPSTNTTTGTGN